LIEQVYSTVCGYYRAQNSKNESSTQVTTDLASGGDSLTLEVMSR